MPAVTSSIVSRVSPEHRQKLQAPMPEGALSSMQAMFSGGLLRPVVPTDHAQAMIDAGYARQGTGGLMLTDEGQARAMMESGQ